MCYIIAITPEEIQTHMKELLSQVHLRILVAGNIYKDVRGPATSWVNTLKHFDYRRLSK